VAPVKLRANDLPLSTVKMAIEMSNDEVGGRSIEMAEREFIVRVKGYIENVEMLRKVAVGVGESGVPILPPRPRSNLVCISAFQGTRRTLRRALQVWRGPQHPAEDCPLASAESGTTRGLISRKNVFWRPVVLHDFRWGINHTDYTL
jgi:hypothetical protein